MVFQVLFRTDVHSRTHMFKQILNITDYISHGVVRKLVS